MRWGGRADFGHRRWRLEVSLQGEKINNYQFAIFEFVSEVKSDETEIRKLNSVTTYTYILYTIYEKKAIIINFSCPEALKDKWQPVAREIMKTVVVK